MPMPPGRAHPTGIRFAPKSGLDLPAKVLNALLHKLPLVPRLPGKFHILKHRVRIRIGLLFSRQPGSTPVLKGLPHHFECWKPIHLPQHRSAALLPATVLVIRVSVPCSLSMPPPEPAVFLVPETVLVIRV